MERTLIVGSSVAGIRTARELREAGYADEIVVLGAESQMPYDKPPLSKQLAVGTSSVEDISLLGPDGWAPLDIDGRLGTTAQGLDTESRVLSTSEGPLDYDHLVIATGVRPRQLHVTTDTEAVFSVRELRDGLLLRTRLSPGLPVVVIGGGFIGAEVASSAVAMGAQVTMVEALDAPFARVLGPEVGAQLTELHRAAGVEVIAGHSVTEVVTTADGAVVRLSNGRSLEAAIVVVGIGTQPNTEWLDGSGVPLDDGVLVDAGCAVTGVESVYAVGDVARYPLEHTVGTERVEHWTNAVEQARVAASQILDPLAAPPPVPVPYFWSDQHGVKIQMVGRPYQAETVDRHEFVGRGRPRQVALYWRQSRLVAGLTFGWPRAIGTLRAACESPVPADDVLTSLRNLADAVALT